MTTKKAFEWRRQELLVVQGVCAVALLLQCGESYNPHVGGYLKDELKWSATGFSKAMADKKISLSGSTLRNTSIPNKNKVARSTETDEAKSVVADIKRVTQSLKAYRAKKRQLV